MLTYGSLFSGIGGIDLGLDRAGMTCKWQVEIDEDSQKVLAKHWPDVVRHRDVRTVGKHNLTPVDLLAGGFPCQDVSISGRRAGIDGARSGLWREFARIIREVRPGYVLVENVPALRFVTRSNGRIEPAPLARVLGDLSEIGYDAEWETVSAEEVGAPHLRERMFIVGYAMRFGCGRQGIQHHTRPIFAQRGQGARESRGASRHWTIEPTVDRLAHGISRELESLRKAAIRAYGNAVVPQVAEYIGRCVIEHASA